MVSGGQISMDERLSYVSPMITESIVAERGIASVSSAPETIGGHLTKKLAREDFGGADTSLTGINRAGGSDIAVGMRLPGAERSIGAGVIFNFEGAMGGAPEGAPPTFVKLTL